MYIKTGPSTWKNTATAYIKTGPAIWERIKAGYIKTGPTLWKRFFFEANLPVQVTAPTIRTANVSGSGGIYDGPVATSPQFLDADLFGKDGSYSNYTSITGRRFSWADTIDSTTRTTVVFDDRYTSAGGITNTIRLGLDEDYLFYEVQVNNGTGDDFINPVSNPVKLIKKQPLLGALTTSLTGNAAPGSILTLNYNLENYYYNRVEQANSRIRWWRSTTTSPGGTMVKEEILTNTVTSSDSTSLSGQSTYTIDTSADNDSFIVVEIVAGSSWTRHNGYNNEYRINSYSSGQVKPVYRFSFGKTLYVSSNGHIGLDAGTSSASSMSDGRNISIFPKDLVQYYLAEYSDSSTYSLYVKSYLYNTSASAVNALDYQIKFYNDPNINYCDVYIVRKGSSVSASSDFAPGYYAYRETGTPGIVGPYVISAGSRIRIYFGGTAATTSGFTWTLIDENIWDVIQTWTYPPGADDIFTAVVSAANQSAPFPTNTVLPTLTTDTGNFSAGSTITINTGTWTGTSSYAYALNWENSTPIPETSTNTKTLVNTNQYVITNADASNPSYYFRGRVTGYAGVGQTGNSAIARTVTSSRSNINPTTTISVGTATATGFTISGTAGPLNGFGSTYANITAIEIFNSSVQLISTITTGLPTVNGTSGAWSYVWTGGSGGTTYYARAKVTAVDTAQTTVTSSYSSSITTTSVPVTPTSLTATTTDSTKITLTWSGGSGDTYLLYWLTSSSSSPAQTFTGSDFTDTASPYEWGNGTPTNPTRGVTYYFFIRSRNGTDPNFTYSPNWYPAQTTGIIGKAPLYTPPTPVITNSAQQSDRLSWHWTQPTPSSTQDEPTSWDYALTQSTADPTTGITNITTRPTSTSPLVTTGLSVSTTYRLHVRAKNGDKTGAWTSIPGTTSAAPFVTPAWNGTMPAWAANTPFVNGNNFRRLASSLQYGWNNGTFSFSGSIRGTGAADRGWDFYVSTTAPATTTTVRTPTNTLQYSTTNSASQIGTTSFIYRVNPTYTPSSVFGSIRPYQFGTDNNKYVRGTQPNGTWSGNI
jgi:hypothetical protein